MMVTMQNMARPQSREEIETLSQPVWMVHLWWLLLGFFTLLIVLIPGLRVTFRHETLSFTLEMFNTLVATMVSFVGLARYVFERRPFDLAIAAAFGTIAVTEFWFGLILPFSGSTFESVADAPMWGWLLTRAVAGVLLLLGLLAWPRGRQWLAHLGGRIAYVVAGVALADVAFWYWHGSLPRLLGSEAWDVFDLPGHFTTSVLAGQTLLGMLLESLLAGLYFWLAYRLPLAVREGEDAWLALALITAFIAQFQFIFYPAPFHPAVTTSDLLWLISYLLLLAYLGHQYVRASGGMRRQQERASALLALSQTPVIHRDPALVLGAARRATQVVGPPATVNVRADGQPKPVDTQFSIPVQLDGVRYGALDVGLADGQALDADAEEYLRIVANQTANLLRAIELYDELADGAVRDERAQLARELHDGLAQDLAVLRLRLSDNAGDGYEHGLADRALSEARYAITILRGQTATPDDFVEALRRQSDDLADRFGVPVEVEQEIALTAISAPAQVAILRISREAITNAGKHAAPGRIRLGLRQAGDVIELDIHDDGHGFDPAHPTRPGAFGLRGMQERAQLLGGTLTIESAPGQGTTVRARLPIQGADGAR
jgi:signal transduction histidine kinase